MAVSAFFRAETIEDGYEITSVLISPPSVTVIGEEGAIRQVDEFILTAPISLTNVTSQFTVEVPLLLPDGVVSKGEAEQDINSVAVDVQISPVTNYLPLSAAPT